jgi:hypothetical protein
LILEPTELSKEAYLSMIKKSIEESAFGSMKDLGEFPSEAGSLQLFESIVPTKWGPVKMLQGVMVKNKNAYILTATLQEGEFSSFSQDIYEAFRSFSIEKDIYEMLDSKSQRKALRLLASDIKEKFQSACLNHLPNAISPQDPLSLQIFESEKFQNEVWKPLEEKLRVSFCDMNANWRSQVFFTLKKELLPSY